MKTFALLLLACPLLVCGQTPAANPAETPVPATPTPPPVKRKPLTFSPSKERPTAPRNDGDGASRGEETIPNLLLALLPKAGAALTTQAQPSLFAYVSNDTACQLHVSILEPKQARPAFIFACTHAMAGVRRIDLADFGVSLKPGVEYRWFVVARPDPKNRSADLSAGGTIKRIAPDAALAEKIDKAEPGDLPGVYAEAGIWYDALTSISNQIAANPKDQGLVAERKALFEQAQLDFTPKAKPEAARGGAPAKVQFKPKGKSSGLRMDADGASQ